MAATPPPGWYSAPHAHGEQRYWDGLKWLDVPPPSVETQETSGARFDAHAAGVQDSVSPASTGVWPPAAQSPLSTPTASYAQASFASPPATAPSPKNLALIALLLGAGAFFFGLIPWFGLLLAVAALVVGILALKRHQSKALAITGTVLASFALLTGVIATSVHSASSNRDDAVVSESGSAETPVADPAEPSAEPSPTNSTEAAETAVQPEPVVDATEDGTVDSPIPQPYTAKGLFGGDKYSLTSRVVDADAGALVASWNMFNDEAPAGFKYVVVEYTMTGIDPDGVDPALASWDLKLATAEGNTYDGEYVVFDDSMPSISDGPTLYPGSAFTGYASYIVPESAQAFVLFDNGKYISF